MLWFWQAAALCLLTLLAIIISSYVVGVTIRGLWRLLTKGVVKEFLSSEGRFCLLMGGLFGIILIVMANAPQFLQFLARLIEPSAFQEPKGQEGLCIWLFFSYCIVNVVFLGHLFPKSHR